MSNENSNCCDPQNSDCDTQNSDCCDTIPPNNNTGIKKKAGLGILLLAVVFAITSAFAGGEPLNDSSCSTDQSCCAKPGEAGISDASTILTEGGSPSCCTKK